jgi:hypothetical protein
MPPKKGKRGSNRTATVEAPLNTQEALPAMVFNAFTFISRSLYYC